MTDTASRQFRPIFAATVIPGPIEAKTSTTGTGYLLSKGSSVIGKDGEPKSRTLMAFGKSADAVRDMLVEGQAVELAVQYDQGTLKIIGPVLDKSSDESEAQAA